MPSVSVVIPVYNAALNLPDLTTRLADVLSTLTTDYEVIFVDDGSRDASWDVMTQLAADFPWVRGIHLMRNYGQHNALLCGIRAARFDVIVTMDDDLQNPPEEIPRLLARLDEGYDVVYGTPQQEQHGLWRNLASRITKLALQSAMGVETARNVSAFRAFRTQVRAAFTQYSGPFVSIDVLLTWGTTRFAAIPVQHAPRQAGVSGYSFARLVTHAINMATGFSTVPLQLASWIGFAFTLFGVGVLVYVVGRVLIQGSVVPGFPFLASVIAIFSGVQLFMIGIFGEYLARMHFRIMDRPAYTVREETEREK
jgi:glycosyltransferase involved in cell wall biosynthesis